MSTANFEFLLQHAAGFTHFAYQPASHLIEVRLETHYRACRITFDSRDLSLISCRIAHNILPQHLAKISDFIKPVAARSHELRIVARDQALAAFALNQTQNPNPES